MPSTVKISQLPSASSGDITVSSDVLPIIDGDTTKQITVENLLIAAGTAISGNLVPVPNVGEAISSFSLGSSTSAWKDLYVSDGTIFFQKGDGTRSTFTKENIDDLKAGKGIATSATKQMANKLDDTTYVRMSVAGKAFHYASDVALIQLDTSSFGLGDTDVPMTLEGSSLSITGSTEISGSATVSGSFTVTDLLTLLGNFGQTGSFGVSGSSTFQGDVNMDGIVTTNDLLQVIAGINISGSNEITGSLVISGSNVAGSPPALTITGSTELTGSTTVDGPFTVTDLLTLLGNFGQTGSFGVSGSSTFTGDVNMDGIVTTNDLLQVIAGINISGSNEITGSLEISGSIIEGAPPALVVTGSTELTGSFGVGNLLDLLANFGQTGIPTGSGEGGVSAGDINLDGVVSINDLLLLIAGMGNPNILVNNLTIPQNTNYQLIGPEITVSQSIVVTVGTNSFLNIT